MVIRINLLPTSLREPAADGGYDVKTVERFWSKVDRNGPVHPRLGTACWVWTAGLRRGYGAFRVGGRKVKAHRFAYGLTYGALPAYDLSDQKRSTVVRHKCDNPRCVNPAHLEIGTQADNNRDRDQRGRHVASRGEKHGSRTKPECVARGEKHGGAKLTEEQVRIEIKRLRAAGWTQKEVATELGVHHSLISLIERGKLWKHLKSEGPSATKAA